jgi:hypothetical protein
MANGKMQRAREGVEVSLVEGCEIVGNQTQSLGHGRREADREAGVELRPALERGRFGRIRRRGRRLGSRRRRGLASASGRRPRTPPRASAPTVPATVCTNSRRPNRAPAPPLFSRPRSHVSSPFPIAMLAAHVLRVVINREDITAGGGKGAAGDKNVRARPPQPD